MTIAADTHIILDVHSPKKEATVGQGAPTVGANDIAIWGNTLTDPEFTTQTIGSFWNVHNAMVPLVKQGGAGTLVSSGDIDSSEGDTTLLAPTAGQVGVYVGADVHSKAQTHFFDRTLKRLCERWLELAKTGSGATPSALNIITTGSNQFRVTGRTDTGGEQFEIGGVITDPDGQTDSESTIFTVPPAPPEGWPAEIVATVICEALDSLVHIRCARVGAQLTISTSAPANAVESFIRRV